MKLTKLDRRHLGYPYWLMYIRKPTGRDGKRVFLEWREWCWNTWGASKEINEFNQNDLFNGTLSSNPHWCWQNDRFNTRIYLKSDVEVTLFALRWL
jgi:hypothetical protein